MNACWCTLAGTEHCLYCRNNKYINRYINTIPYKKYFNWHKPFKYNTTTVTTNSIQKNDHKDLTEKIIQFKELNSKEKQLKKEKEKLLNEIEKLLETIE